VTSLSIFTAVSHYTQGLRSIHLAMFSSLPTPRSISLSVDLTMPSLRFTALRSSLFLGPCDPQNPVSPRTPVVVFVTTLVFANRSSVKRIAGFIRRPPFSAFAVRTGHAIPVRGLGDLSMLSRSKHDARGVGLCLQRPNIFRCPISRSSALHL
jgi:hypothetical protein